MVDSTALQTPAPFSLDGVQMFGLEGQPGALFYIPAAPIAESDPRGLPTVSVVRTPKAVMLQAGTRLALAPDAEAALKAKLQQMNLQAFTLQPAALNVREAVLLLVDETGAEQTLASSKTSRFAPYAAIFSVTLDAAKGARAISAVNGQKDVLFVEYRLAAAAGPLAAPISQELNRRADVASWFAPGTGAKHVQIVG